MAADTCFPPELVEFSLVPLLTLCFAGNTPRNATSAAAKQHVGT